LDPALALPTNHGGVPRHGVTAKVSIGLYVSDVQLDSETQRVLSIAVELTCIALRTGDCDEGVRQAIARKIIELAQDGERDPNILCEQALNKIREPRSKAAPATGSHPVPSHGCGWPVSFD
jgi:hypothetical protein